MGISLRLQEERRRLGLTQEALAEKLAATKRSVINWEGGAALPGAEVLSRYAAAGADVLYILTGQRIGGASAPEPEHALSQGDRVLLENFHAAPIQVQAGIKTTLGAFADASHVRPRKRAA
jgi:transcriptional regulator with XRE-family HTH domain